VTPPEPIEQRLSRWLAWAAGAMILVGCGGLISLDVVTRAFAGRTVVESFEFAGYAFGAAITWSFAYALASKANVRVDLIVVRLPRRLSALFDLIATATLLGFALPLAWYATGTFLQSWALDARAVSVLQTPLVWPQGLWLTGIVWLAAVAFITTLRAAARFARGDLDGVERLVGNPRVEEEIDHAGRPTGPEIVQ
jgi:TRAP-type C4-dicarboxylate transport system permease small subunit